MAWTRGSLRLASLGTLPCILSSVTLPYKARIDRLLTPRERSVFKKLSTPQKIQDFLDTLPINFEMSGDTYKSPRAVLASGTAHCFEGAVFAPQRHSLRIRGRLISRAIRPKHGSPQGETLTR